MSSHTNYSWASSGSGSGSGSGGQGNGQGYVDDRERKRQIQAAYRDEERRLIDRLQVLTGGTGDKRANILARSVDKLEYLHNQVDELSRSNAELRLSLRQLQEQSRGLQALMEQQGYFLH
ncbi:hypothetical protein CONPUDRAFT_156291 [Coniophora puteana RWD-64-598 SS2]|uniref:BHLH domain-containing protein n=1 Tax=Coniophora puteana (strain RWD-64-598) TaxID=741705 RepID=A0A5M3MI23_CONPW|nr:uncharacterized protein CONPUDRAFT_156291 [Coniophora puteana RWD-64-598 SS2]EIW78295.1 hypothetical protein CONPUDRAFT_156291 [Coniophora puteana RWD-64-598 SS2]